MLINPPTAINVGVMATANPSFQDVFVLSSDMLCYLFVSDNRYSPSAHLRKRRSQYENEALLRLSSFDNVPLRHSLPTNVS